MDAAADADEWISLREFGRRRGVSLTAVQKAIADKRVIAVKREGKRLVAIEFHLATKQWAENTDPDAALRSGTLPVSAPASQAGAAAAQLGTPGEQLALDPSAASEPAAPAGGGAAQAEAGNKKSYLASRASREEVSLELDRLKLAREAGAVTSTDETRAANFRRYRGLRDQLRTISDRLSDLLAAETDAARVRTMLQDEIDRVLHGLADDAQTDAANGDSQRPAA